MTSPNAAPSSVPLMPSKTSMASAAKPAGPVTAIARSPSGSDTRSRTSAIGSRIVSDSPSPTIEDTTSAASRVCVPWPGGRNGATAR